MGVRVMGMVFNATFNNISAILWQSVLFLEETGIPWKNLKPLTNLYHIKLYRVHFAMSRILTQPHIPINYALKSLSCIYTLSFSHFFLNIKKKVLLFEVLLIEIAAAMLIGITGSSETILKVHTLTIWITWAKMYSNFTKKKSQNYKPHRKTQNISFSWNPIA